MAIESGSIFSYKPRAGPTGFRCAFPLSRLSNPLWMAPGAAAALAGLAATAAALATAEKGEAAVAAVAATATVVVEEEEVQAVVVAAEAIGRSGGVAAVNRAPREREAVAVPALTRA